MSAAEWISTKRGVVGRIRQVGRTYGLRCHSIGRHDDLAQPMSRLRHLFERICRAMAGSSAEWGDLLADSIGAAIGAVTAASVLYRATRP